MSSSGEKHPWFCPGCQRKFLIAAGKAAPEFCPNCLRERSTPDVATIIMPPAAKAPQPPARDVVQFQGPDPESFKDPAVAKWKPLAVVLPQTDLDELVEANRGVRERRYYSDLAWSVLCTAFLIVTVPVSIALVFLAPPAGILLLLWVAGVRTYLCWPASGALKE